MNKGDIDEKYIIAMQQARAALSQLPLGYVALTMGNGGKNKLDPQPALYYLSRLIEAKEEKWKDLALRTIQEKLPIWHAAAQQKGVSARNRKCGS